MPRALHSLVLLISLVLCGATSVGAQPGFSKGFSPGTTGPASVSTLTFTVDNSMGATPVADLAFTDVLPAGVTIANPPNASTTCVGGVVTAPAGGTTITLSGGGVGANSSCTVAVNVTASVLGLHMNTSGDLTSSAGNSGTATATLTVDALRPGFTKSFSPSSVSFGGRSTVTFTVDNAANPSLESSLAFSDNLPSGMVVAVPPSVTNTCTAGIFTGGIVTATAGSSVISLAPGAGLNSAAVAAMGGCTITVDVIGGSVGMLGNTSGDLSSSAGLSGKAAAVLTVTGGASEPILLQKGFIDDPVAPGGTVTLRFTILNTDRFDTAAAIAFTDDLTTALAGLVLTGVVSNTCSVAPTGTGTSTVSFSGGTLAPEASCSFDVTVTVPTGATPGTYTNTTSTITATIGGMGVAGSAASDLLFIDDFPLLTKSFTDDPVGAGGTVTLEFTITNTSTSAASAIAFTDTFDTVITGASLVPAPGFCGAGSMASVTPLFDPPMGSATPAELTVSGASLAPAGMMGDSCTFSIILDVVAGAAAGIYPNITSTITATVGGSTKTGPPASDGLVVVGAPTLTKVFTDDPVAPGGTVTLQLTLSHDALASADATAIAFMDDLSTVVMGLTAASVDSNTCTGSTIDISTPTLIDFSGGTLMPGASCTVSLMLAVSGMAASGIHNNTTSDVTATVGGVAVSGNPGIDDLVVTGLRLTKEFTDDPALPGDTVTLRFTLDNTTGAPGAGDATGIMFSDDLAAVLPGSGASDLSIVTALPIGACGGTLTTLGINLTFSAGSVAGGTSCFFDVTLMVPAGTASGTYGNTTSILSAVIGGSLAFLPPATDSLVVESELLGLTKSFTDDPAIPGGAVNLQLTLTNLDPARAASAIAFTDDLGAALSGLTFTSITSNTCSVAPTGIGSSLITFMGGSLAAGASCTMDLSLTVPAAPLPGNTFTNTTSDVTGTINGFAVTGPAASDSLVVRTVTLDKTFADPVAAGNTVVLTFDITNLDSVNPVTALSFSDDLSSLFAGLTATVLPAAGFCGPSSTISGTTFLAVSNASLLAGGMCSFNVTLSIPANAAGGSFANITSSLFSSGLPVAAPASDTLDVVTQADLVITKTDSVDPVTAGNSLTYTVTVTNNGPSDAQNVVVTDTFPAGVTLVSTAGCAEDPAGAPTCTLGTIPAGGMAQYTLTVAVNPSTTGTLVNMASVSSSTTEGSPGDESTSEMTTVATAADLGITKTDSVDPVTAGNSLTYTVTVTNNGPSDAQNVVVTDTLPAGVTLVSTAGCAEDPAGAPTCTLGTIPAGGMAQYTLTVAVSPSTTGTLLNMASVSSSTTEDNPGDESATEMTAVTTSADLVIIKTDSPDPVTAGSSLVYTVTVDNNGPSDALGVVVTDILPAGVTLVSTAGCAEDPVGVATCTLGTVPAGGSAAYTITVTVLVDGTLVNNASVTSSTPEGNPGQESTSETTTAVPAGTTTTVTNLVTTYSDFDQTLNLIATVNDSLPVNDGTVTFRVLDGAIQIGATVVSPTVAAGSAAALYTLPGLTPPNTYTIEATYSGGVGFAGSMGFGTLTVDPVLPGDTDGDGVDDATEDAAPNGGDANIDGIPDRLQSDVTSLPSTDGPYLTLITQVGGVPVTAAPSALTGGLSNLTVVLADRAVAGGAGCQHRNVMVVDQATLPPDTVSLTSYVQVRSPLSFELECSAATATILYFGIVDLSQATYRKFGPTLADPSDHWYTLQGAVFGTTTVAGATVATATIVLVDGGQGDHDLTADNRIVDPGGAAMVVALIPTLSQWALILLAAILGGVGVLAMRSRL